MTDDVKALIEPADEWDTRAVQRNPEKAARYIQALADALEAATAEMHSRELHHFETEKLLVEAGIDPDAKAATASPAVDREALAKILDESDPEGGTLPDDGEPPYSYWYPQVDAIMAALGARDVRDVQAEALEESARAGLRAGAYGVRGFGFLTARARAIREARND